MNFAKCLIIHNRNLLQKTLQPVFQKKQENLCKTLSIPDPRLECDVLMCPKSIT